jgi:hypothetical protein
MQNALQSFQCGVPSLGQNFVQTRARHPDLLRDVTHASMRVDHVLQNDQESCRVPARQRLLQIINGILRIAQPAKKVFTDCEMGPIRG